MKNKRLRKYLQQKAVTKNNPISKKQDIQNNSDKHIDQDFEGYPHGPAKEEIINPKTRQEKKVAAINIKDGEKMLTPNDKKKIPVADEKGSDGSTNAFEGTETLKE